MKRIIGLLILLALLLVGCTTNQKSGTEKMTLTVGVMPAVGAAPIFLAKEQGYFDKLNLDVTIQVFSSPQDRQTALQTNTIDGAITDLIAVATNVNSGFDIKATTLTEGMFIILANEESIEKKSVSVGLMEISVTNFLVDQWLGQDYTIEKVYINAIPARLEALVSGQLDMGIFPEPVASSGAQRGLKKLIFEPIDGFSPDVMVFTKKARDEKADALKAFHEAYNLAVKAIKDNETLARDTLIKNIPNVSEDIKDLISLPEYHEARLPDIDYLNKIINWTNGVLEEPLTIEAQDLIDTQFIR